jgi:hypothetical protein
LRGLGQFSYLRPILLISCGHFQRQQMSQGIYGGMDLRTLALLVSVKARSGSALRRRLHRATIHNHGGRIRISILNQAQNRPQIVSHRFKAFGSQPPLGLLLRHPPGRKLMRQQPSGTTGPYQPPQRVEHLPQAMRPLRRLFLH